MLEKKWYRSKTVVFGAAQVISAMAAAATIKFDWKYIVMAGCGALVIALRTVTNSRITK